MKIMYCFEAHPDMQQPLCVKQDIRLTVHNAHRYLLLCSTAEDQKWTHLRCNQTQQVLKRRIIAS